jgi:hypothetical protein
MRMRAVGRSVVMMLAAAFVLTALPTSAQIQAWTPNGVALCSNCNPYTPLATSDGSGGGYFVWASPEDQLLRAQHVAGNGLIASGWPNSALRVDVATAPGADIGELAPDGQGGVYIGSVAPPGSYSTYLIHVAPDGTFPQGWPPGGLQMSYMPSYIDYWQPSLCSDGAGGVFFAMEFDTATTRAVRMHHVLPNGQHAPGWPPGGLEPVPMPASLQANPALTADESGGAYLFYTDLRNYPTNAGDIYCQRVRGDGTIMPGWPATGLAVCTASAEQDWDWNYYLWPAVGDGAGGAYIAWNDWRNGDPNWTPYGLEADIYLARVRPDGTFPPGWPVNGLGVCVNPGAFMAKQLNAICPDGFGGVFVAWEGSVGGVRVQRILAGGTVAPGWTPNLGAPISTLAADFDAAVLCPDGLGGVWVAAESFGTLGNVVVQHLNGAGQPAAGWTAQGVLVTAVSGAQYPGICSDGAGGAIVAWADSRLSCRAQHYPIELATPVAIALAGEQAGPDHVALAWAVALAKGSAVTVERAGVDGGWQVLGEATVDGSGTAAYDDRTVVSGTRYGYRVTWGPEGAAQQGGETWVDVPGYALALAGAQPNPAVGSDLRVAFTLPDATPAALELLDVAGRRIARREVGTLGAGRHVEPVSPGQRVAAGLYWLRLTQGGQTRSARTVVVR